MGQDSVDREYIQKQLDGLGNIDDGVEIPKEFFDKDLLRASKMDEWLQTLESINGLSDEEKLELRKELIEAMAGQRPSGPLFGLNQTLVFILAISLVFSILAFFGLKLYRSLSERERKLEEKRRLKQQKKKK